MLFAASRYPDCSGSESIMRDAINVFVSTIILRDALNFIEFQQQQQNVTNYIHTRG
jgi:hypothetical protein